MARARYYTPPLDRDLVTSLYHAAKARRILMTWLASSLVREGLARLSEDDSGESCIVREEPPVPGPHGRTAYQGSLHRRQEPGHFGRASCVSTTTQTKGDQHADCS